MLYNALRHFIQEKITMKDDKIMRLLERYDEALSAGDTQVISDCWEVPALVLSDEGAVAVNDKSEIEKFFSQAIEWYRTQGITSTRPELERADMMSDKLASVDVRWPAFDQSGIEKSSERSHYILQLGKDGQMRIRVAIKRTG